MRASIPAVVTVLRGLGLVAILVSAGFLGATFVLRSDIYRAFCLGAFFASLIGIVLLFGFAKIIDLLETIRVQTAAPGADAGRSDSH